MKLPRPLRESKLVVLAVVAAVVVGGLVTFGSQTRGSPPLTVNVGATGGSGDSFSVTISLASHRAVPVPVHVALVPVGIAPVARPVYYFTDPAFPCRFGTAVDASQILGEVRAAYGSTGMAVNLTQVNATGLSAALNGSPDAVIVMLECGVLPATVFSPSVDHLSPWLRAGGTLVWAGGPLGFYSSGPIVDGTAGSSQSLLWAGQDRILGYPLVDPIRAVPGPVPSVLPGPIVGNVPSPLATGFGMVYNGTPYGANLSELAAHGGFPLGYATSTPAAGIASARTSLAYVPVGRGSVFYFGGAVWADSGGPYVPEASGRLAADLAEILAIPWIPEPGEVTADDVSLGAFSSASVVLTVEHRSHAEAVWVESSVGGTVSFLFVRNLASPFTPVGPPTPPPGAPTPIEPKPLPSPGNWTGPIQLPRAPGRAVGL